jgi:hypothetical protein
MVTTGAAVARADEHRERSRWENLLEHGSAVERPTRGHPGRPSMGRDRPPPTRRGDADLKPLITKTEMVDASADPQRLQPAADGMRLRRKQAPVYLCRRFAAAAFGRSATIAVAGLRHYPAAA